jgi:hypothetical protein
MYIIDNLTKNIFYLQIILLDKTQTLRVRQKVVKATNGYFEDLNLSFPVLVHKKSFLAEITSMEIKSLKNVFYGQSYKNYFWLANNFARQTQTLRVRFFAKII